MKKVLFLMPTVFNHGGEQRTVTNLCNSFVKNGYEVSLLLFDKSHKVDYSLYNLSRKVNVNFIDNYNALFSRCCRKIRNINSKIGFLKHFDKINLFLMKKSFPFDKIVKFVNDYSPEYVIGVASEFNILCYFLKQKFPEIKIIGWQHSCHKAYFNTRGRRHFYEKKLVSSMYKKLDQYVVLTKNDQYLLKKELGLDSTYIYNMKSFSSNIKSDLSVHSIMSAGRMDYIKGFDLLIDAFCEYNKKYPNNDWNLDIYGDGQEKENLINKIKQYNLMDKIIVHPFTDDIISEYKKHSIYIMPSRWEGFPLTIGECYEMNLPMICFDIDVVKEFIENNIDGIFVPSFDANKLADAILELTKSEDLRKKIAYNQNKKIDELSEKKIMEKWKKILNK